MQSAPNEQSIASYLSKQGHNYSNDRALVEALKDTKTFLNISKDLLEGIEFGHIRSWMATQAFSFSTDPDRTKSALPLVNDFLALTYMFEQLELDIKLAMFMGKPYNEKWMMMLGKIINFLKARNSVLSQSENIRIDYQLMFKTLKNASDRLIILQNQIKETQALKQKEKPSYERSIDKLNQIKNRAIQLEEEKRLYTKQIEESESQSLRLESRVGEFHRSSQQTEIKIAQIKRELIRFAPDIKKESEHLDCRTKQKKDLINFKQNGFRQLEELLIGIQRKLKQSQQLFEDISSGMKEKEELESIESKRRKEFQEQQRIKAPKLSQTQQEIKKFENSFVDFQGTSNRNDLLKEGEQKKIEETQALIAGRQKIYQTTDEGLRNSELFKNDLESQRKSQLLRVGQVCYQLQTLLQEKKEYLESWKTTLQELIKRKTGIFKTDENSQ